MFVLKVSIYLNSPPQHSVALLYSIDFGQLGATKRNNAWMKKGNLHRDNLCLQWTANLCASSEVLCIYCLNHFGLLICPSPPPVFSLFLLPQTWFSARMRWMWTSLSWLTHCLRGPLTPAGLLSSSPSPLHTNWWSTAMRSVRRLFLLNVKLNMQYVIFGYSITSI